MLKLKYLKIVLIVLVFGVMLLGYGGVCDKNDSNSSSSTPLPSAASALSATAMSGAQINLFYQDNSNNEDGFKIERKIGTSGTYAQITIVSPNVIAYSDTGVSERMTYFYRVCAYNEDGNSMYTDEASAITPLNDPSYLTAMVISSAQISLTWTDNSTVETGFKIERKIGSGGTYTEIATVGTDIISYSDTGLTELTSYYYRLKAYDSTGTSDYSNEASTTTLNPWIQKITDSAHGSPPQRSSHTMVWDGSKVIMFGGHGAGGTPKNDLWWYDPISNTWAEKIADNTVGSPPQRYAHTMVWDGSKVIMFGGIVMQDMGASGILGVFKNDLWWYEPISNTWTEKIANNTAGAPPRRCTHSMAWDGTRVIMFGAYGYSIYYNGHDPYLNDLWWYEPISNTWTEKIDAYTAGSPSLRTTRSIVWDGSRAIIFGAYNMYTGYKNDLWWYDPTSNTWTEKITNNTAGSPPQRYAHSMVWDGSNVIMFGGYGSDDIDRNDLWWYSP